MKRFYAVLLSLVSASLNAQSSTQSNAIQAQSYEAAEQRIQAKLKQDPLNNELRSMLARTLAQQNKFDAAIAEYKLLLQSEPDNGDYHYAVGLLHVWRGTPSEGLPELDIARRLAPDYEEVWQTQVSALETVGGNANLTLASDLRRQAAQKFPKSAWTKVAEPVVVAASAPQVETAQVSAPAASSAPGELKREMALGGAKAAFDRARPSTIEVNANSDHLSNGSPNWKGAALRLTHQIAERHLIALELRQTRRFGLRDSQVEVSYTMPLTARLTGIVEGSVSPSHRILPRNSVGASLQYEFAPTWFVHGGLNNTRYANVSVTQGKAMLEHYFGSYRLAGAWRPTRAFGTTVHSGEFRFDYYYSDLSSVGVTLASGQEAAATDGPTVVVSDVRSIVVNGRHWLNRDWAMHYEIGSTKQGDSYTRNGVLIGVQRAF